MDIGFIGLGNMGRPIARNLLAAGHSLRVYNRTRARAEALEAAGAEVVGTPGEAAGGEVVVTMLADDEVLEPIVFGPGGLVDTMAAGAIHLSMSTISADFSVRLTVAHADAGQRFVAAPVFGRPEMAAQKLLFIVAAGEPDAVEICRPLLEAVGQRTFLAGTRPAAANLIKLANNFMLAAAIESMGEAIALIRKSDVDPQQFVDFITATNFSTPLFKVYAQMIADAAYEPAGFALHLGLKDVNLALRAAAAANVPMPFASTVRDTFVSAVARGYGEKDWGAIAEVLAENAGLSRS